MTREPDLLRHVSVGMRGVLLFLLGMTGSILILGPWAVLFVHRFQVPAEPSPILENGTQSGSLLARPLSVIRNTNWSDELDIERESGTSPAFLATQDVQEMAWTMALTEAESEFELIVFVKYPEGAEFRLGSIWLRREAVSDILARSTGSGFDGDGPMHNGRRSGHGEHTDFNVRHENGLVVRIRHSKYNNDNDEYFGCDSEFTVNAGLASMKVLSDGTFVRWEFARSGK